MSGDLASIRLTLGLAYRARIIHAAVAGRCDHCRSPAPCPASRLAEHTIAALAARRAIGIATVHPLWAAGTDASRSGESWQSSTA